MPTALSLRNNSKGYAVRSSQDAYGIVPPKQLRGLRGTVIIIRDRADTVTAGVLTKEIFFFFLDTSSALALHRTPSLLVKHVRGG